MGSGKRPTSVQTNDSVDGGNSVVGTGVDEAAVVAAGVSDDATVVSIVEGSSVGS